MTVATPILDRVIRDDDCLIWQGARNSKGYGCVTGGSGRSMLVHRRVWIEAHGPIPAGLTIDHLCRHKLCVNVDHMEVVTRGENVRRKLRAQLTCKRGHLLAGSNVRLQRRASGLVYRVCRTCDASRFRRSDVEALLRGSAA